MFIDVSIFNISCSDEILQLIKLCAVITRNNDNVDIYDRAVKQKNIKISTQFFKYGFIFLRTLKVIELCCDF